MITKSELIEAMQSLDVPVHEGITSQRHTNVFPRIVFWEYVWEEVQASDSSYDTVVTYQISIHYQKPREKIVLQLRKALHELGLRPTFYHEFIDETKEFHTYLSVSVLENLDDFNGDS